METTKNTNNLIEIPTEHYQELFAAADPEEMSERTGIPYSDGKFSFRVLNEDKTLSWPEADDECFKPKERILFMRYLLEGKKVGFTTEFAAYKEFPDGAIYNQPFTGRCIYRMLGSYGKNTEAFIKACEYYGGHQVRSSGIQYEFEFMKNLFLRFILWEGDDEFPANMQILFSKNFPETFSAEDRVVVCEYLIGRMQSLR
jgi:hypothetical protein